MFKLFGLQICQNCCSIEADLGLLQHRNWTYFDNIKDFLAFQEQCSDFLRSLSFISRFSMSLGSLSLKELLSTFACAFISVYQQSGWAKEVIYVSSKRYSIVQLRYSPEFFNFLYSFLWLLKVQPCLIENILK